ncbi:hypothetical protein SAMN05192574_101363 [Mucilaginibacter gossypiicola]|uniref:ASCH domain-containing protein n=1 Tax=Mucilaginibacter gossypiicola TaxID=551995 RepID=A0A1H8A7C3_9SPHI|nr:hypothetical protein [Mucilaginibacter gossypiicola]SEM65794.1 hypothetical protein SAMN05192574_101363 [Mucilaginibacter gossypiicola]
MKEYPILFSTAMVQAILAGNKTVTRREIKQLPTDTYLQTLVLHASGKYTWAPNGKNPITDADIIERKPPFGEIGSKLWVREEHLISVNGNHIQCVFKDLGAIMLHFDEIPANTLKNLKKRKTLGKWQRARFLPKCFARIWLEITEIEAERLHDITETDILREGVRIPCADNKPVFKLGIENSAASFLPEGFMQKDNGIILTQEMLLKAHWAELWCKINGRENYNANPWVWAIFFKVISTNGKHQ